MTIELHGLTKRQYQLADLLWSCDSQQQVDQLKSSLPAEYQREAETVHQLLIAAVFDEYEDVTEDVRALLDGLR